MLNRRAHPRKLSVDSLQVELIVEVSPGPSNELFVLLMLRVPGRFEAQLWRFSEPQDPYDADWLPPFRLPKLSNTCSTDTAIQHH
jgi:hypothetical protein